MKKPRKLLLFFAAIPFLYVGASLLWPYAVAALRGAAVVASYTSDPYERHYFGMPPCVNGGAIAFLSGRKKDGVIGFTKEGHVEYLDVAEGQGNLSWCGNRNGDNPSVVSWLRRTEPSNNEVK